MNGFPFDNLSHVSSLILILLGLICLCVTAITVLLFLAAAHLRRTSEQLRLFVSHGDAAMREAQRTLGHARQLLQRTDQAASQIQGVIRRSCDVAEGVVDQIAFLKERAQSFWTRHARNGAKTRRSRNGHYRKVTSTG